MLIDSSSFKYTAPEPEGLSSEYFEYTEPLDPVEKIKRRTDKTLMQKIDLVKEHLINECGITDDFFAEYLSYYCFKENKMVKKWLKRTDKKNKKKVAKL